MARSTGDVTFERMASLPESRNKWAVTYGFPSPYSSEWRVGFSDARSTATTLPFSLRGFRETEEKMAVYARLIPEEMKDEVDNASHLYFEYVEKTKHEVKHVFEDIAQFVAPKTLENGKVDMYLRLTVRLMHLFQMSIDELVEVDKKAREYLSYMPSDLEMFSRMTFSSFL